MKRVLGRSLTWAFAAAILLSSFAFSAGAPVEKKRDKLVVPTLSLNKIVKELDGQWQANLVASDGNVYFFSSAHNERHGAAFFRYNPATKDLKCLIDDITKACGEDPLKTVPQGKVHSDMWELDGSIYFGTHLARYAPGEALKYPGAHVLGLDMKTEKFRDYGVIHPNYSIYSGFAIDAPRKVAYVYVRPFFPEGERNDGAHLYRLNLVTGEKQDLGRLFIGGRSCYHFFIDASGNCWFGINGVEPLPANATPAAPQPATTPAAQPVAAKADAADAAAPPAVGSTDAAAAAPAPDTRRFGRRQFTGTLYRVKPGATEVARFPNAIPDERSWLWVQALPDGKRCLLTLGNDPNLWIFDSTKEPIGKDSYTKIADIGPQELGMVADKERVYWISRADRKDFVRGGWAEHDLHLFSVAIDPGPNPVVVDHGLIFDEQGRQPWKLASMSTDGKGQIYVVGAWYCLPEEEKEFGVPKGRGVITGQFFCVMDVSKDIAANATATK
jgi:hypothetical protein